MSHINRICCPALFLIAFCSGLGKAGHAATIAVSFAFAGSIFGPPPSPAMPSLPSLLVAAGSMTPFGAAMDVDTGETSFVFSPAGMPEPVSVTSEFVITFADGADSLSGNDSVSFGPPDSSGISPETAVRTILGGSGIFAGASGVLLSTGFDLPPGPSSPPTNQFSGSGQITAPALVASPEPDAMLMSLIAAFAILLMKKPHNRVARGSLNGLRALCLLIFVGPFAVNAAQPAPECLAANARAVDAMSNGKLREAEAELSPFLQQAGTAPQERVCRGLTLCNMAIISQRGGNYNEAERYARESVSMLDENDPVQKSAQVRALEILVQLDLTRGQFTRAGALISRLESMPIPSAISLALLKGARASVSASEGKTAEAERAYRSAIAGWQDAGKGRSADMIPELDNLALLYLNQGRLDEAAPLLADALRIVESDPATDDRSRVTVLGNLGVLCAKRGDWPRATEYLRRAWQIAERTGAVTGRVLRTAYENYAACLQKMGRKAEAKALDRRAGALLAADPSGEVVDVGALQRNERQQY